MNLDKATRAGNIKEVIYLLSNGCNINIQNKVGYTPLHVAVEKGYPEIVKLLIEKGGLMFVSAQVLFLLSLGMVAVTFGSNEEPFRHCEVPHQKWCRCKCPKHQC